MRYLGRQESLHDVDDVEAFVISCMKRSGAQISPQEWEDMLAEGLALLYKMAGDFDEGRNEDGGERFKFSGYAIRYLPKKIKEAWHRSRESIYNARTCTRRVRPSANGTT